jgi:hypothetical protein
VNEGLLGVSLTMALLRHRPSRLLGLTCPPRTIVNRLVTFCLSPLGFYPLLLCDPSLTLPMNHSRTSDHKSEPFRASWHPHNSPLLNLPLGLSVEKKLCQRNRIFKMSDRNQTTLVPTPKHFGSVAWLLLTFFVQDIIFFLLFKNDSNVFNINITLF